MHRIVDQGIVVIDTGVDVEFKRVKDKRKFIQFFFFFFFAALVYFALVQPSFRP